MSDDDVAENAKTVDHRTDETVTPVKEKVSKT
jgi:hypothetical protein